MGDEVLLGAPVLHKEQEYNTSNTPIIRQRGLDVNDLGTETHILVSLYPCILVSLHLCILIPSYPHTLIPS